MAQDCEAVQLALVEGMELSEPAAAHVAACSECQFLRSLSRAIAPTHAVASDGRLGAAVRTVFARAIETREALLGRYQIEELRGRGGQGEVYRALDLETSDTVALKIVRAAHGATEVSNARRVQHPNVARVFHTERHGELRLIVMEYVAGGTLADRVRTVSRREALALFRGICAGVQACHEAEILHLDLKPQNVLMRGDTPVVTDFGLSSRISSDGTAMATGGTPRYMAPEQRRRGEVDRRTDVFALGRLLQDLGGAHKLVDKATDEDPGRRFSDVTALLAALDAPVRRWRRLRKLAFVPLALVAIILVLPWIVPAPTGPRGMWRADVWGEDTVSSEAWNVARNATGTGLPSVEVSHRLHGCGQRPYEILDGRVTYTTWEHGVAFSPAPSAKSPLHSCVPLKWLGACGELRPDDRLCRERADGTFDVLDRVGRDIDRFSEAERGQLGIAHPHEPCGERRVTVQLDDTYLVIGVRAWFHGPEMVPRAYRIEVDDSRPVFVTTENVAGRSPSWFPKDTQGHPALPVTAEFTPVRATRVSLVMDTCTSLEAALLERYRGHDPTLDPTIRPGNGWLYELEVFAVLSRHGAWWRHVFGND